MIYLEIKPKKRIQDSFASLKYEKMIPMNLAFFNDSGEKTEQATPRKKEKSREEGQVLKSQEVSTAALFLSVFLGLRMFSGYIYEGLLKLMHAGIERLGSDHNRIDINYFTGLINDGFLQVLLLALPIFAIAMVAGLLTNIAQVGWHPTTKPLMPKFSKISPMKGFKRLFSMRAVVELVKSILKLVVIGLGIYIIVMGEKDMLPMLIEMELLETVAYVGNTVINIGIMVGAMYIFIAGFDFLYQWWKHTKELRMTKQEVKEEYKQTEGNPQIKGQIRQKMREASMRRMMQDVPTADVIITNPTRIVNIA